jgi:hypothetical protein
MGQQNTQVSRKRKISGCRSSDYDSHKLGRDAVYISRHCGRFENNPALIFSAEQDDLSSKERSALLQNVDAYLTKYKGAMQIKTLLIQP